MGTATQSVVDANARTGDPAHIRPPASDRTNLPIPVLAPLRFQRERHQRHAQHQHAHTVQRIPDTPEHHHRRQRHPHQQPEPHHGPNHDTKPHPDHPHRQADFPPYDPSTRHRPTPDTYQYPTTLTHFVTRRLPRTPLAYHPPKTLHTSRSQPPHSTHSHSLPNEPARRYRSSVPVREKNAVRDTRERSEREVGRRTTEASAPSGN